MSEFSSMTMPQLTSAYNGMVTQAQTMGLKGFKVVKSFHDKDIARERCTALATAISAASEGRALTPDEIEKLGEDNSIHVEVKTPVLVAGTDVEGQEEPEAELTDEELNERRQEHTIVNGEDSPSKASPEVTRAQVAAGIGKESKAKKKAPAKAGKKAKGPVKPDKAKPGRKTTYPGDSVITVLVKGNPKRPGTTGYDHFALYKSGMSVSAALAAGITRPDLTWDVNKGYIKIK